MQIPLVHRNFVTFGGVSSPYLRSGPQDSEEAVVFLHGNPGSSQDWERLLSRVGEFGRAVDPDMPGYGRADKPEDFDYTVEGYARHLDGVLKEIRIKPGTSRLARLRWPLGVGLGGSKTRGVR